MSASALSGVIATAVCPKLVGTQPSELVKSHAVLENSIKLINLLPLAGEIQIDVEAGQGITHRVGRVDGDNSDVFSIVFYLRLFCDYSISEVNHQLRG